MIEKQPRDYWDKMAFIAPMCTLLFLLVSVLIQMPIGKLIFNPWLMAQQYSYEMASLISFYFYMGPSILAAIIFGIAVLYGGYKHTQ